MTAAAAAAPVSCRMAVSSSSSSSRDPLLRRGSVCQLRGSASQLRGSSTTTTMGLELQQGSLCLSISFLSSLLSAESRYSSKHLLHDAHHLDNTSSSGASVVAIDNKIEQAMDLVKSHLMFAVREEVEVLKEQIKELIEKNSQLEQENNLLKTLASPEQMAQFQTQVLQSGVTPPAPSGGPTPSSTQQGAGSAAPITAAAAAVPVPLPPTQQQQQQPGVSYTSA